MIAAIASQGGGTAAALAIVLAVVYVLVLRFVDLNEKEPLWATALAMGVGTVAAVLLRLLVPSRTLELSFVVGPMITVLTLVVAIALVMAALNALTRNRGVSEVNGLMDGVVYGAATGLGFWVGSVFVRELLLSDSSALSVVRPGALQQLWTLALAGLALGVFGGIAGAGFGAASVSSRAKAPLLVAAAAVASAVVAVLYSLLARGAAVGQGSLVRAYIALLLPVLVLVGLSVFALLQERRAIRQHMHEEVETGAVTRDELDVFGHFTKRRAAYLKRLLSGDIDGWGDLKALHNRQVQLALARDRAARAGKDSGGDAQQQVEHLRAAIEAIRIENPSLTKGGAPKQQAEA